MSWLMAFHTVPASPTTVADPAAQPLLPDTRELMLAEMMRVFKLCRVQIEWELLQSAVAPRALCEFKW